MDAMLHTRSKYNLMENPTEVEANAFSPFVAMLFTMKYTIQQYLLGNHIPGHPKLQMYCDETEYMFEYSDRGTRYIDGSMSPNFLLKRAVSCFY